MERGRPEDWHVPGTVVRNNCEKLQPFSRVVMKSAGVLRVCICGRSTSHSIISPDEKYRNAYPVGPFAKYYERRSLFFTPPLYAVIAKHPKTGFSKA